MLYKYALQTTIFDYNVIRYAPPSSNSITPPGTQVITNPSWHLWGSSYRILPGGWGSASSGRLLGHTAHGRAHSIALGTRLPRRNLLYDEEGTGREAIEEQKNKVKRILSDKNIKMMVEMKDKFNKLYEELRITNFVQLSMQIINQKEQEKWNND